MASPTPVSTSAAASAAPASTSYSVPPGTTVHINVGCCDPAAASGTAPNVALLVLQRLQSIQGDLARINTAVQQHDQSIGELNNRVSKLERSDRRIERSAKRQLSYLNNRQTPPAAPNLTQDVLKAAAVQPVLPQSTLQAAEKLLEQDNK